VIQGRLLDSIEEPVIGVDLGGRIISWNRAAVARYGLPVREALGQDLLNVIPLYGDESAAREWLARVRRGQSWTGEYHLSRRGSSDLELQVLWFPLRNASGTPVGAAGIHAAPPRLL